MRAVRRWSGRELVRGHHGARFRAQQAHAVYLSTPEKDPGEGEVVVQRRPETLTSRLERHVVGPFSKRVPAGRRCQRSQVPLGIEPVRARAASSLLSSNDETRVAHAQRPEDAPLEDSAERDTVETRDEEAEQVGRQSVMKVRARLIDQRQHAESCDPLVRAECVVDRWSEDFGAGAGDRAAVKLAVGEARAVRQEIAERDRPLRRIRLVQGTIRIAQDAKAFEFRSEARDRLVQGEPAFVVQHQGGDGRQRLRHRRDSKNRPRSTGVPVTRSLRPTIAVCTTRPSRHTRVAAPARVPAST